MKKIELEILQKLNEKRTNHACPDCGTEMVYLFLSADLTEPLPYGIPAICPKCGRGDQLL